MFGKKLKEFRERKKLSKTQLAEITGLSIVSIIKYEKGLIVPTVKNIGILSKTLECDFEELYELALQEKKNGK